LRVEFRISCRVIPQQKAPFQADSTRDFSLKGLYVITGERDAGARHVVPLLEKGTLCKLELGLEGLSAPLTIMARVVRVDKGGIAFMFDEMDIETFLHLKNILYYNSGNPERIDKEIIPAN